MSDPAGLLRDLIENMNCIPPEQLHLLEPALTTLMRRVQEQAAVCRERRLRQTPLEVAMEWLCDLRAALWDHDPDAAINAGNRALQLLRWDTLSG